MVSKWKRSFKTPKNHPLVPKSLYSALFSGAVKIYIPVDSKVKKRENRATRLHAVMTGSQEFAKSRKSNALNADIASSYLWPTMWYDGTFQATMILGKISSWAFIRCCSTKPASF